MSKFENQIFQIKIQTLKTKIVKKFSLVMVPQKKQAKICFGNDPK